MKNAIVCRSPNIMGGPPGFCGTRVPVQTLLDYLEAGDSIDEFLAGFPSVTRAQVIEFLRTAKDRLVETVDQALITHALAEKTATITAEYQRREQRDISGR